MDRSWRRRSEIPDGRMIGMSARRTSRGAFYYSQAAAMLKDRVGMVANQLGTI